MALLSPPLRRSWAVGLRFDCRAEELQLQRSQQKQSSEPHPRVPFPVSFRYSGRLRGAAAAIYPRKGSHPQLSAYKASPAARSDQVNRVMRCCGEKEEEGDIQCFRSPSINSLASVVTCDVVVGGWCGVR